MSIKSEDMDYISSHLSSDERAKLKDATILVTGCGGFLGYYFLNFFHAMGDRLGIKKVIGLDNFMLGRPEWIDEISKDNRFVIKKFDIIKDHIDDIQESSTADFIIHMASIASPVFYRKYPIETLDANIWGLRSLLDYYKERNIKGFLFFSSSEIYGDPDAGHIPTKEDFRGYVSCTGPRACYDESKRFGETMCRLFSGRYDMPIGVVRPFNNYGPGMRITDKRVPADFAKAVFDGKDIEILSNGKPTRTFCYIADAITGYLKILLYGKYDFFNIGIDRPEISIRELAEIYASAGKDIFGYKGTVRYDKSDDSDYLTNNPERRCPDISKAVKLLGYDPSIYAQDGVERFLRFISENDRKEYIW
jgi:UDP-glucuronate decarboxylase